MKVLMLNYEFPPLGGGAANANRYLLKKMEEKDIEIDLVTSAEEGGETENFSEDIVLHKVDVKKDEIHYWTQTEIIRYMIKGFTKAKRLSRKKEYDVVHAWFGFPCGFMAQHLDIPYIVSLRGSDVPGYNERFGFQYIFLKPIIKSVWKNADSVIANSEGLRELARDTLNTDIRVIPNGVDVSEFKPGQSNSGKIRVLTVARLIERKRIDDLIKAVENLDVELEIVGEGDRKQELEKLVTDLGIEDKVDFRGFIEHENLPSIYRQSDVFVLPSLNEGMSNTILEAMASGLPIITTDTGGTDELIEDNGKIVDMKSPDDIRRAIQSYIDNPGLIDKHGENSRNIAENMSWAKKAEAYIERYERAAK